VIEINPQAAEIAAALDRELAEGHDRGPLHGLPVLIKDNLDRNPSRSSSGSGVAAAASLCAAAVGTETDGSIMGPSCLCGLVGIKPTVGLVGRSGIIPERI
jgi:Asp-tRNA(Asn)/Glu-tRNA(Gln) amidotransferase A subunit family amidase